MLALATVVVFGTAAGVAQAGTIEGQVTGDAGGLLADICVQHADGVAKTRTDSDGRYSLSGVSSKVRLQFSDCGEGRMNGSYLSEYYDNAESYSAATLLSPGQGTLTGIDASLRTRGRVSGRITDAGGTPLSNVSVTVKERGNPYSAGRAVTGADGRYSVAGVPSGKYLVELNPYSYRDLAPSYYGGATDAANAAEITVSEGATTTGIDGRLLEKGRITGRILEEDGTPIQGVCAETGGGYRGVSGADGTFTIARVDRGTYSVRFVSCGAEPKYVSEYYDDSATFSAATTISVNDAQTTQLRDARLIRTGSISGRVTDSRGAPFPKVCVRVNDSNGPSFETETAADGSWRVAGLPEDDYFVSFPRCTSAQTGYIGEAYDNVSLSSQQAKRVPVQKGQETSGIDATLTRTSSISGTVVGSDGGGALARVCVTLYWFDGSQRREYTKTTTDSSGKWVFSGLSRATYTLEYRECNSSPPGRPPYAYLDEFHRDRSTLASADPIELGTEEDRVVNESLQIGAKLRGTVTDEAGLAASDVCVGASPPGTYLGRSARTDAHGEYTIHGLTTGDHRVFFRDCRSDPALDDEYYENSTTPEDATSVWVTAGEVRSGVNAALGPRGGVVGTVSDKAGQGVGRICVFLTNSGPNTYVKRTETSEDGTYLFERVARGSYRLRFTDCNGVGFVNKYFENAGSYEDATPIAVRTGETTRADVELGRGDSISGRTTDTSGKPISDVCVSALDGHIAIATTRSLSDGTYEIGGLAPGSYGVRFQDCNGDDPQLYWFTEYYDNARERTAGKLVTVRAGQATTGIDASLADMGRITGRVFDGSGAGIEGICITLRGPDGFVTEDETVHLFYYGFSSLYPGHYRVTFQDCNGGEVVERKDGRFLTETREFDVVEGSRFNEQVTMRRSGRLSGKVSDSESSAGLDDICVSAMIGSRVVRSTVTDGNGEYLIPGLDVGDYIVRFRDCDQGVYATEYYEDAREPEDAEIVRITPESSFSGVDAALHRSGSVSGSVKKPSGQPLGNSCVSVYSSATSLDPLVTSRTAQDGSYTIDRIPIGEVRIGFAEDCSPGAADEFQPEYWNDRPTLVGSDPVRIDVGQTTPGIDATLAAQLAPADPPADPEEPDPPADPPADPEEPDPPADPPADPEEPTSPSQADPVDPEEPTPPAQADPDDSSIHPGSEKDWRCALATFQLQAVRTVLADAEKARALASLRVEKARARLSRAESQQEHRAESRHVRFRRKEAREAQRAFKASRAQHAAAEANERKACA